MTDAVPEPAPAIQPQPLPTQFAVAPAQGSDGTRMWRLTLTTPQGVNTYFLDLDNAARLGQLFVSVVQAQPPKPGLTIARGLPDHLPPGFG